MQEYRLFSVTEVKRLHQQVTDLLGVLMRVNNSKEPVEEVAWLIEWPATEDSQAKWWHPVRGWTIDASRAARFCRQEDAQGFIDTRNMVKGVTTTEHKWIGVRVETTA